MVIHKAVADFVYEAIFDAIDAENNGGGASEKKNGAIYGDATKQYN